MSKHANDAARMAARADQYRQRLIRDRSARHARGLEKHRVTPDCAPPTHVIDARDRALGAPQSLTSLVLGDPPPGRSALDRKREIAR